MEDKRTGEEKYKDFEQSVNETLERMEISVKVADILKKAGREAYLPNKLQC